MIELEELRLDATSTLNACKSQTLSSVGMHLVNGFKHGYEPAWLNTMYVEGCLTHPSHPAPLHESLRYGVLVLKVFAVQ